MRERQADPGRRWRSTDAKTNKFIVAAPTYLGPTWWHAHGRFVLGADNLGRDVAVRLLYGGLNSLKIGIGSALICTFVAVVLALLAGYNGGWIDWISHALLRPDLGVPGAAARDRARQRPGDQRLPPLRDQHQPGSLWIPTLVISYVLIPYIGAAAARPDPVAAREGVHRGRRSAQGAGPLRIMFSDLLPNIASTVLVFFTLIIADQHPHRGRALVPRRGCPAARTRRGAT